MQTARVLSFFLVISTLFGCAVGEAESDESVDQSEFALFKNIFYFCIRDRSDLPDGHNIDSWLIACWGKGGDVICSGDTPMCCKGQPDGGRECSVDPADISRGPAVDLGGGAIGTEVTTESRGKEAAILPGDLGSLGAIGAAGDQTTEPEIGSLERTKGEDLEKCLHQCPREPGKVETCRRNCMCLTGHRPRSDCDLIDLAH